MRLQAQTVPVDLRRRGCDEEISAVRVIGQIAAEAGDARAEVRAVARVQLHRAVPAQEGRLGVVIREDLQPA